MRILKRIIRFFRPVYWPLVKVYFVFISPETQGVRIVLTYQGEILFVKNSYGLKYNFPGGGIGRYENPEQGIRREVKEELGIDLGNILYVDSIVPALEYEYRKNTISIFTAELPDKNVYINSLEVEDVQWFTLSSIPSMGHAAYQIFQIYKTKFIR